MLFTKTQRIIASIAFGAAVGAFIGKVVSALSPLAGFASGGVTGGFVRFVAFNFREISQRALEIWKQIRRNASKTRTELVKRFAKSAALMLFWVSQWIGLLILAIWLSPIASLEGDPKWLWPAAFMCTFMVVYAGCAETDRVYRKDRKPEEFVSEKFVKHGNILSVIYYVFRGTGRTMLTAVPIIGKFLFRSAKAVYSNESLLVIIWAAFGAIAGIWLATTPVTAAFAGAIAGAIFGGLQVYFICIPLGLISPATNNH
jgi:hypothetical protein